MTVTFKPKNAARKSVECQCMTLWLKEHELLDGHDDCDGYFYPEGADQAPELNITSMNGELLVALLELQCDEYRGGEIEASDLLCLISQARRKPLVEFARGSSKSQSSGLICYEFPCDEDKLRRYLDDLAQVANWAIERDTQIIWH